MSNVKKSLYNVAISGQGYVLARTPLNPARQLKQSPIYTNRFASGDRSYEDFSLWWILAQTDWSGGIKQDNYSWADDAHYFYSDNIDAWSNYGQLTLVKGLALENTFAENISCGLYGNLGGFDYYHIGTSSGSPIKVYSNSGGSWADRTGANIDANATSVSQILSHKQTIWILCLSGSTTTTAVLSTIDEIAYTNHTAAIITALGITSISSATTGNEEADTLYIAVVDATTTPYTMGVAYTDDNGTTWNKLFTEKGFGEIIDIKVIGGNLYYLINEGSKYIFRVYNISAVSVATIWTFYGTEAVLKPYAGGTYMTLFNNKIVIRIIRTQFWLYDINTGTLTRLFKRNETLNTELGGSFYDFRFPSGVLQDNKVWLGNLMFDGQYLFNTRKNYDNTVYFNVPLMTDGATLYVRDPNTKTLLYKESGYKTTGELVFNRIDIIASVDKLWHSVNFSFSPLTTTQIITFFYSIDERTTWQTLGTASYANDGGSIRSKILQFPSNIIAKTIWLKVQLTDTTGLATPALKDMAIYYLPMPNYKLEWLVSLYCYDNFILLDGKSKEPKTGEQLKSILENNWWNKQTMFFEDIDYSETKLSANISAAASTIAVNETNLFAEQGRLNIEGEEIFYNGKTATTFLNCQRGQRGTGAATHNLDIMVSNGYNVIITNYTEKAPVGAKAKITENIVSLELREI